MRHAGRTMTFSTDVSAKVTRYIIVSMSVCIDGERMNTHRCTTIVIIVLDTVFFLDEIKSVLASNTEF